MLANIIRAGLRSSELRRVEQGSQPNQDLSLEGWQAELLSTTNSRISQVSWRPYHGQKGFAIA